MSGLPNCPECGSDLTYTDGTVMICPMCAHEWTEADQAAALEAQIVRDANGSELSDGDNDIECTIEGSGRMYLKSELVKKI